MHTFVCKANTELNIIDWIDGRNPEIDHIYIYNSSNHSPLVHLENAKVSSLLIDCDDDNEYEVLLIDNQYVNRFYTVHANKTNNIYTIRKNREIIKTHFEKGNNWLKVIEEQANILTDLNHDSLDIALNVIIKYPNDYNIDSTFIELLLKLRGYFDVNQFCLLETDVVFSEQMPYIIVEPTESKPFARKIKLVYPMILVMFP